MNRREKDAIDAVRDVLLIQPPIGGLQTTTVLALSRYAQEMSSLTRPACRVLEVLLLGESYDGELDDDVRDLRERLAVVHAERETK